MTNAEFQVKLEEMYETHKLIAGNSKKTFNTLVWLLRQDSVDYNISIPPYEDGKGWMCIPSVKEFFIPAKELAMHVKKVEVDEEGFSDDDFKYDGICLTVWLED
jgi:hypothetical protein